MMPPLPSWGADALYAGVVLPVVWLMWRGLRKTRRGESRGTLAVRVAAIAATGCTAYSADTDWRFAADYLNMGSALERTSMFGAAELALFATALMARQNLNGPTAAPGVPGLLVWLITTVQIIPAYAESGPIGGTVRAFVGPFMAAMLWHLAMGIELRHRKPGVESNSLAAVVGRELRERLLSRLGVAERDRDAAQITRDRATVRASALAAGLAEKTPEQRATWRGRRTARRLAEAVARSSVGVDREQRRTLLGQLAARRHAVALATISLASPWEEASPDPAASALADQVREQMRQATETIRRHSHPSLLFADPTPGRGVNRAERSPEHPAPHPEYHDASPTDVGQAVKLSAADAQTVIQDGWARGLSVRETAKRATRAPSYVHGVFVKLDTEHGCRPTAGQLALAEGQDQGELSAVPAP